MSTVPSSLREGQPTGRKAARPTHGSCRLSLTINGSHYIVRPMSANRSATLQLIRLRKANGTTYHVSRHSYRLECDCPDFIFNREGIDPAGCKHVKALVACGLFTREGGTQ